MQKQKLAAAETAERNDWRQKNLIDSYRKKETWMKWVIIGTVIVIVLLLLLLGLATDWTRGLHKDNATASTTPLSSNLDSLHTTTGSTTIPAGTASTGDNGSNGGSGNNGSNGTDGTNGSTSTTTNTTNSTTTTNTTTTTPQPNPSSGLLQQLYTDTSAGDNINDVLDDAKALGVSAQCHNEVLVQVCDFVDGTEKVTVRNILGTDLITGVTNNF